MYGGPTGFPGAERYQYPLDSEEGRAISALRQMRQDGTAPDTLIVQVLNFARPQFENAFPEGAPTYAGLFEEETGIRLEFIETDAFREGCVPQGRHRGQAPVGLGHCMATRDELDEAHLLGLGVDADNAHGGGGRRAR